MDVQSACSTVAHQDEGLLSAITHQRFAVPHHGEAFSTVSFVETEMLLFLLKTVSAHWNLCCMSYDAVCFIGGPF